MWYLVSWKMVLKKWASWKATVAKWEISNPVFWKWQETKGNGGYWEDRKRKVELSHAQTSIKLQVYMCKHIKQWTRKPDWGSQGD